MSDNAHEFTPFMANITPYLDRFQLLKHDAFFKAVTVDPGGYGISWNDDMDVSEYELWHRGVAVESSAAGVEENAAVQRME